MCIKSFKWIKEVEEWRYIFKNCEKFHTGFTRRPEEKSMSLSKNWFSILFPRLIYTVTSIVQAQ